MRAGLVSAVQPPEQPLQLVGEVFVHLPVHERHRKAAGESKQFRHTSQEIVHRQVMCVANVPRCTGYSVYQQGHVVRGPQYKLYTDRG